MTEGVPLSSLEMTSSDAWPLLSPRTTVSLRGAPRTAIASIGAPLVPSIRVCHTSSVPGPALTSLCVGKQRIGNFDDVRALRPSELGFDLGPELGIYRNDHRIFDIEGDAVTLRLSILIFVCL